ncbi:tetratricopeptide repeat protein [uncultured Roseivirga sp.]|uniref:tetratricopeptide repeat protein n=1 Tax=uncultured Roseivirga sp. TaxID=543088 RepID=UPI0030DAA6B1|tara:strand:+ start:2086 stop:3801 length:1716 start_codon:yes stop_codon:yes gene_type:complete
MNEAILAQQRLMQAIQNYQTGDLDAAEKELRALQSKFPKSDQILSLLGTVLYAKKKYKDSFRSYQEALKINPNNEDALINIGTVEKARGKLDIAIELMNTALKKLPTRADIYYNLGTVYLEKKDLIKAEATFKKCVQIDSRIFQAEIQLVSIYKEQNELEKAETTLRSVLEKQYSPELEESLKEIVQLRGGQFTVQPKPTKSEEKIVVAEQPSTKESSPEEALGINDNDIQGLMDMAGYLQERYKFAEAEKYFIKVLNKVPNHKEAQKSLRKLRSYKIPGWHFDMLEDTARNDAYQAAIENALKKKPNARVLDIGTGSGLLAMMAARAGAAEVVACEMHTELAGVAKEIVKANGYADKIKVINKKSSDLVKGVDFTEKFDLIVSEILDCGGLGEGVVPTLRHAKKALIKTSGIMLPAGIKLYGQLIEIPKRYLVNPIKQISGFDLSAFDQFRPLEEYSRIFLGREEHTALTEPFFIRQYDFLDLPEMGPSQEDTDRKEVKITSNGNIQAIAFWFDLKMDDEEIYSSGPKGEMVHWGQAIYFFGEQKAVSSGDSQSLQVIASDSMLKFRLDD